MALARRTDLVPFAARQAAREILLWTTRDGREIPLDEMSDEHVANAVRVLSLWRSRLKKRGGDEAVVADLKAAITRFKALQRRRRKHADPSHSSKPISRLTRGRKPVAST